MTASRALTLPRRPPSVPGPRPAPGTRPVSGVRRRPAIATEPPYDDELEDAAAPARTSSARGRAGRRRATTGEPEVLDRTPRSLAVPESTLVGLGSFPSPSLAAGPGPDRRPGSGADGYPTPPPREAVVIVVRAIVEALGGVRPVSHLTGWTTPRLQNDLERLVAQVTERRRGQVRSVRVSEPRPGVAEVSAVISRGARMAALALRMESLGGRWRVTTLQVG